MEPRTPFPPTPPRGPDLGDHDEASEIRQAPTMNDSAPIPEDFRERLADKIDEFFGDVALSDEDRENLRRETVKAINDAVNIPVLPEAAEAVLFGILYDLAQKLASVGIDAGKSQLLEWIRGDAA